MVIRVFVVIMAIMVIRVIRDIMVIWVILIYRVIMTKNGSKFPGGSGSPFGKNSQIILYFFSAPLASLKPSEGIITHQGHISHVG